MHPAERGFLALRGPALLLGLVACADSSEPTSPGGGGEFARRPGGGSCEELPITLYYADPRVPPPTVEFPCIGAEDFEANGRNALWFNDWQDPSSGLPEKDLIQFNAGFDSYELGEHALPEGEIVRTGEIRSCDLGDGRVTYAVEIDYEGLPFTVWDYREMHAYTNWPEGPEYCVGDVPEPILGAGPEGSMDIEWKVDLVGPADVPIPFLLALFFGMEDWQIVGVRLEAHGRGTMTAHAADFGWIPGEEGEFVQAYSFGTLAQDRPFEWSLSQ